MPRCVMTWLRWSANPNSNHMIQIDEPCLVGDVVHEVHLAARDYTALAGTFIVSELNTHFR